MENRQNAIEPIRISPRRKATPALPTGENRIGQLPRKATVLNSGDAAAS